LTNSLGQVTDTYEYDAFGNTINKTTLPTGATPTPNNYLYRGEQFDPDLSLYYLRARYYNASTGRFLSSDPLAGDGERRYEYADADPVNGMDPTGDAAMIEFELINMRGSISVSFPSLPSWCQAGKVTSWGVLLPPCKIPKLGIGIEVPSSLAVWHNVLNVAIDPGHTFVYLKDPSGSVVSILSFGPALRIRDNKSLFEAGDLPGTGSYRLEGDASTWESFISPGQLSAAEQDITNVKGDPPEYTESFNCTSAALSIPAKVGVNLPNGVGPVMAYVPKKMNWSGNEANPYTLNNQMTAAYGSGQVVSTSTFPTP
jgi:RHS repeat-associated protein